MVQSVEEAPAAEVSEVAPEVAPAAEEPKAEVESAEAA